MTLQVSDYLDSYLQLCNERDVFVIGSFRKSLQDAVEGGPVPETFKLNGNQPDLSNARLKDSYIDIILSPLSRSGAFLRELDLSCNEIGDAGAGVLAAFLKDDMSLEVLDLHSNNISSNGVTALARALHVNDKLNVLDLSDNVAGNEGGMELANMLQINSTLTHLHLRNTYLTATPLVALATVLRNNTTLIRLDISNNHDYTTNLTQSLSNDVMMHMTRMLALNYTLREIALAKMGVTDWQVMEYWARALKTNLRIEMVDLSCNRISRDGGVSICRSLYNHPSLGTLKLSRCSIQDEGAEAVSQMLQNNFGLQSLHLDYNAITGKGLVAIAQAFTKNFSLKQIKLWGNKWDVEACEAWAKLVGGPVANIAYGDDLSGTVVEADQLFPRDGRRTVSVRAHSAKEKGAGNVQPRNYDDPRVNRRFKESEIDVAFYAVEGVLSVARRD
ncbi:hypothetical protein SpCBS45565_g08064 [Spizellomyces sp. 'palustris']|nr:hypothetical protein SpCBS45565_g08064 [Spizellomyces sp. 'palustris']